MPRIRLPLRRLHLELTSHCNYSCDFCPDGIMKRPRGFMEPDLARRVIDEVAEDGIAEWIFFHLMGEPILHPELADAVRHARSRGLETCVTTNGSLLSPEKARDLAAAGLSRLVISIQHPNSPEFNGREGRSGSYADYVLRVSGAAREILQRSERTILHVSILCTPFKTVLFPDDGVKTLSSTPEVRREVAFWLDQIVGKADRKHVKKFRSWGWTILNVSSRFMVEVKPAADWAGPFRANGEVVPARFGSCHGLTEHLGVLWDGKIVFCCADYEGKTSAGRIGDLRLLDFLRSREAEAVADGFRKMRLIHPHCQACRGGRTRATSAGHQIGSILYFKVLRRLVDHEKRYHHE